MCFYWLQCLVALLQRRQSEVDFNGDFSGRVVVVCGDGIFDLARVVDQSCVKGFQLVLAVVDVVRAAVDGGGAKFGE
jgi:hypothetical protein